MKSLVVLAMTILMASLANSQRPYYAPRPVNYPGVAERFRTPAPTAPANENGLDNRAGEVTTQTPTSTVPTSTYRVPIDARGDADLVNRINQWPREHRPYWYLNAEQIEQQRGRTVGGQQQQTQQGAQELRPRSSFVG